SMVRSAAKNHQFVTIVTDPADYPTLLAELEDTGATSLDFRRKCAAKAFAATAAYDSMISQWFGFADQQQLFPDFLAVNGKAPVTLRYGENPHQQ
ncbi:MAG TPA: bifunctional phosphoribosylaminoimidazolecarboxamide formyltransferase/inosine monophosphate cyclohydrolase, partial [Erythrobacter sp.]|nr:bifunctional phosphoribosylaminoimidazolecarboxamide formyltransferase/inosine monophosphate cyclohydrolase [Erythrobacter sp.]